MLFKWLKIVPYMQGYLVFHTSKSLEGFNIELRRGVLKIILWETLEMFKTYYISASEGITRK